MTRAFLACDPLARLVKIKVIVLTWVVDEGMLAFPKAPGWDFGKVFGARISTQRFDLPYSPPPVHLKKKDSQISVVIYQPRNKIGVIPMSMTTTPDGFSNRLVTVSLPRSYCHSREHRFQSPDYGTLDIILKSRQRFRTGPDFRFRRSFGMDLEDSVIDAGCDTCRLHYRRIFFFVSVSDADALGVLIANIFGLDSVSLVGIFLHSHWLCNPSSDVFCSSY